MVCSCATTSVSSLYFLIIRLVAGPIEAILIFLFIFCVPKSAKKYSTAKLLAKVIQSIAPVFNCSATAVKSFLTFWTYKERFVSLLAPLLSSFSASSGAARAHEHFAFGNERNQKS